MAKHLVNELRKVAAAASAEIACAPGLAEVLSGVATQDTYAAYLGQTFHYVRHSKAILAACAEGLRKHGGRADLVALFEAKAQEEGGHENWALSDLAAIGFDRAYVETNPPTVAVQAYLAWSMMIAKTNHAAAFLGAAYVLESLSVAWADRAATNLVTNGAIPNVANGVKFLRGHGAADGDHVTHLEWLLDTIDDKRDIDAIVLTAEVTRQTFAQFVDAERQTCVKSNAMK